MTDRRVWVTGLGAVTPLGTGVPTFWERLCRGESGIRAFTRFDPQDLPIQIGGEVPDFDPLAVMNSKEARQSDRVIQFAVAAAEEALAHAHLNPQEDVDPTRFSVAIGTAVGGLESLMEGASTLQEKGWRRLSPHVFSSFLTNMAAARLSIRYGAQGPVGAPTTACAAAADAIAQVAGWIQSGIIDVGLAGGTEAVFVPMVLGSMASLRAVSSRNDEPHRASRPFDRHRDGMVMGEGAGVLVLESAEHAMRRGARPLAELSGVGLSNDAYHVTAPAPDGRGQVAAMRAALAHAGVRTDEVDYIKAHATSTPVGDQVEAASLHKVFGADLDRIPVSSIKGAIGHTLGACGAIESIACVKAIEEGVVPPNLNYETPDPDCPPLAIAREAIAGRRIRTVLANSFGFGGQNVCLVLKAV